MGNYPAPQPPIFSAPASPYANKWYDQYRLDRVARWFTQAGVVLLFLYVVVVPEFNIPSPDITIFNYITLGLLLVGTLIDMVIMNGWFWAGLLVGFIGYLLHKTGMPIILAYISLGIAAICVLIWVFLLIRRMRNPGTQEPN